MPLKPKQGAAPNATLSAPPKQRSKPAFRMVTTRAADDHLWVNMPTEQLTYAQIAERLSISPEAARAIVKRHRLPRSRSNDGKTLAAIDLKEIRHKPLPARSSRGHRSVTNVVATLKARVAELETELAQAEERSAGHRVDFERERADQLVTTQDRMVAELEALRSLLEAPPVTSRTPDMARHDMARADSLAQSMRSLLEAAQQAARPVTPRPVTPRTWREMVWSERWRWLRRTG